MSQSRRAASTRYGIEAYFDVPGEIMMAKSYHQVGMVAPGLRAGPRARQSPSATSTEARPWGGRTQPAPHLSGFVDLMVGLLDPGRLFWGLVDAVERLGVRLYEGHVGHWV